MLIKLGEAINVTTTDIQQTEAVLADTDLEIEERMRKFAQNLKAIAPMAKDFLYFTCVMMHAAEHALLDNEGNLRKTADGRPVEARWEPVGKDSIKWVCTDSNIKPFANSNRDVFPEMELKRAHKKWVGRPLCLDHKSASVDMIRGVIVDTFYDERGKRVIALCALDKKNYGDLARKVASGYATNVSMGTAVGRAICTDCHRVARTESDFCSHMRAKSCYGEINLDLSPIELSIVVSAADPKAKIKHIIARDLTKAAESLSDYVDGKISLGNVSAEEIADIKKSLAELNKRVDLLLESSAASDAMPMTESQTSMVERVPPESGQAFSLPESMPSVSASEDLQSTISGAQVKLAKLSEDIEKLSSIVNINEESKMTTKNAYMQGTVEPNAGGVTYPPQPGQEARNQDKHMTGPAPFPGVGPVDGQYPGVGESDAEVRKRLLRQSEEEQRSITRQAALEKARDMINKRKEAYIQGTEEPKTYPKDPLQEKARKEDKHMVGAPPFPGVGKIDGLYGDDMATKEKLCRASLKAKFRKVSSPNGEVDKANSRWDIYADDKLILTATVDQISRGNSEVVYSGIATADFGKSILNQLKAEGYEKVVSKLVKNAQPAAPAAVPGPGAPATEPALPPMPEAGNAAPEGAPEGEGNPEEKVTQLEEEISKAHETVSDLVEMMGATEGAQEEIPSGPEASEGEFAAAEAAGPAGVSTASLQGMRRTLNKMFLNTIPGTINELRAHAKELEMTRDIYANKIGQLTNTQRQYLDELAADGIADFRSTRAKAATLMEAFVKYAYGAEGMVKRAQGLSSEVPGLEQPETGVAETKAIDADAVMNKNKQMALMFAAENGDGTVYDEEFAPEGYKFSIKNKVTGNSEPYIIGADGVVKPNALSSEVPGLEVPADCSPAADSEPKPEADCAPAADGNNDVTVSDEAAKALGVSKASINLNNKEGRAMYRTKLAQKGLQFSDMLNRAHPGAGPQAPNLDVKPTGDLAKIETLEETHRAVLDLANAPPRVRKQAEEIAKLVTAGALAASEVDELVAQGVDSEAVKYWKQYFAEAKDPKATEFAAKLTQEFGAQKKAEELETEKVRIKRAYDLAYEMRDRGVIEHDQVGQQVDEIMSWNDEGFNSVKSIVAKQPIAKRASVPNVGLLSSDEIYLPAAQTQEVFDLQAALAEHWNNRKL